MTDDAVTTTHEQIVARLESQLQAAQAERDELTQLLGDEQLRAERDALREALEKIRDGVAVPDKMGSPVAAHGLEGAKQAQYVRFLSQAEIAERALRASTPSEGDE